MRRKISLALLAGALAIPSLYAQGPPPDEGQGGPGDGPGMHRRMGPGGRDGWSAGEEGWRRGGEFREMGGHHRGRGEFAVARIAANPEMREKLGITEEQAAKIQQQTSEFRKTSIRSRAEIGVKRVELEDLLRAENPDRAAIDRKMDEIGAARITEAKARVHYRLAMREALTPEQRKKLRELRREHMEHRFEGQGEGPRGPRGPRPPAPNQE